MTKLTLLLAALTLTACQPDTKNLEHKIDELNKKLDQMAARGGIGAGQPQRPQRPEPDRSKTYAVAVDGDPFDGPADAKVTLVKAYDYACPYCEKVRDTKLLSSMKWSGKVGAFEGAAYEAKGLYRPAADCIMFTRDDAGFCPVCRRAIERIVDLYARP